MNSDIGQNREWAERLIDENVIEICSQRLVKAPLLSVSVITFNHAKYVEQTLDSIVAQKTDFPFEVVIGDDGSNDGTIEILMRYQERYPDTIRLLLFRQNLGRLTGNGRLNLLCNLTRLNGKYVAMVEGDDYWTDPEKLQKQVGMLEQDSDNSLCFHLTKRVDSKGNFRSSQHFKSAIWTTKDILNHAVGCPIHVSSMVFNRAKLGELPDWFVTAPNAADWAMVCLLSERGRVVCINQRMSCYRIHPNGLWSSSDDIQRSRQSIKLLKCLKQHFGNKYAFQIDYALAFHRWHLSKYLSANGKQRSSNVVRKSVWGKRNAALIKLLTQEYFVKPAKYFARTLRSRLGKPT